MGSILLNYDYDKLVQVYGFGAVPKFQNTPNPALNGNVSHFFPCSGDPSNSAGHGIQGIFELYNVDLSGPTYFGPALQAVNEFTRLNMMSNPDNYTVCLILTDGAIHDMDETIGRIVEAANNLPLSVVIVGVGDANFRLMEQLDGDGKRLRTEAGVVAKRDIVQFVPFRKFGGGASASALASSVLRELPKQVTSFFEMMDRPPNEAVIGQTKDFV